MIWLHPVLYLTILGGNTVKMGEYIKNNYKLTILGFLTEPVYICLHNKSSSIIVSTQCKDYLSTNKIKSIHPV